MQFFLLQDETYGKKGKGKPARCGGNKEREPHSCPFFVHFWVTADELTHYEKKIEGEMEREQLIYNSDKRKLA